VGNETQSNRKFMWHLYKEQSWAASAGLLVLLLDVINSIIFH